MLLAYCHLLLSIAALLSHLYISSPLIGAAATGTNPAVRQTVRYDPDNESLGLPYDLHTLGNSNRDDGVASSRHHDDGCHGTTPPTQIPPSQVAATSDVFYPSNSI